MTCRSSPTRTRSWPAWPWRLSTGTGTPWGTRTCAWPCSRCPSPSRTPSRWPTRAWSLSVVLLCGMDDAAGDWAATVGLPAESGISGGLLAAVPAELGLAPGRRAWTGTGAASAASPPCSACPRPRRRAAPVRGAGPARPARPPRGAASPARVHDGLGPVGPAPARSGPGVLPGPDRERRPRARPARRRPRRGGSRGGGGAPRRHPLLQEAPAGAVDAVAAAGRRVEAGDGEHVRLDPAALHLVLAGRVAPELSDGAAGPPGRRRRPPDGAGAGQRRGRLRRAARAGGRARARRRTGAPARPGPGGAGPAGGGGAAAAARLWRALAATAQQVSAELRQEGAPSGVRPPRRGRPGARRGTTGRPHR